MQINKMKHVYFSFIVAIIITFFLSSNLLLAQEEDGCKTSSKKAEKYFNQAVSAMKSSNYPEAIKLFREAIDEDPDYAEAYYGLGKIYLRPSKFNLNLVKKYYKKVVELCPEYDIYCYYYLGDIYLGEDNLDSAHYYMSLFIEDPDKIKKTADYEHADSVVTFTKTLKKLTGNPVPFNPLSLKNISTERDEYLPLISPDNELAFYVRKIKQAKSKDVFYTQDDSFKEKFMFSVRNENGDFDAGNEMPFPFNQTENQGAATITIDDKTLYFVYCEWLKDKTYYNCDICMSEYVNDRWGDIVNLGTKVNGLKTWESQPSISSDGKTLYFISDRPGGYGGYDIYKSTKDSLDQWTAAVNVGANINSPLNEKTPYIHTDNMTLYFSSMGWQGLGGYDIFFAKKRTDGKFGNPVNIGYPINTASDDVGFIVSTDGHYGYFASNMLKGLGGWDIYSFELYADARPDTVLLVKGNIKDETNNELTYAKVELKNVNTKQVTQIPVDSASGRFIFATLFKNDYILTVKKEDYSYTSKYISKEDSTIKKAPTHVKMDFEIKPIEVGQSYRLNDIHFEFAKHELTEDSKRIIDDFFEFLMDHPTLKVSIHGHTDNISGVEFNQTLSEVRAKAVYDYLVERGVDASRLNYKGFGLSKPVASNDTEAGRTLNRRTEFVIIEK